MVRKRVTIEGVQFLMPQTRWWNPADWYRYLDTMYLRRQVGQLNRALRKNGGTR